MSRRGTKVGLDGDRRAEGRVGTRLMIMIMTRDVFAMASARGRARRKRGD
jgi:hypothetical protein